MEKIEQVMHKMEQLVPREGRILIVGDGITRYKSELAQSGYAVDRLELCSGIGDKGFQVKLGIADGCTASDRQRSKELPHLPEGAYAAVLGIDFMDAFERQEDLLHVFFGALIPSGRLLVLETASQTAVEDHTQFKASPATQGSSGHRDKAAITGLIEAAGFRTDSIAVEDEAKPYLLVTAVKPRYHSEMSGYRFISADIEEDLERVWRLRYEVYCLELGVEPENESGLLIDEYDEYGIQLLALDGTNTVIGTMRIVPNNPKGFQMESDFPLQEYMKANGIVRAAETGRFVIRRGVAGEARMMASFGLFQLLSDYCMDTRTNDVFGITHMGIVDKYEMDWVKQIGEPFRYPPPSTDALFVPIHSDFRKAYKEYLGRTDGDS